MTAVFTPGRGILVSRAAATGSPTTVALDDTPPGGGRQPGTVRAGTRARSIRRLAHSAHFPDARPISFGPGLGFADTWNRGAFGDCPRVRSGRKAEHEDIGDSPVRQHRASPHRGGRAR